MKLPLAAQLANHTEQNFKNYNRPVLKSSETVDVNVKAKKSELSAFDQSRIVEMIG